MKKIKKLMKNKKKLEVTQSKLNNKSNNKWNKFFYFMNNLNVIYLTKS